MKKQEFKPWVGRNYQTGINGNRVMVLGESHYCAVQSDAHPNMTTEIISDLLDKNSEHEGYKNTYTKFERALAGKPLSTTEKEELWNRVIFYNYVQCPISEARKAPTNQEFDASEQPFFDILEKYQPDNVLVWGKRLYNHLPRKGYQLPDLEVNGDSFEVWAYELTNGHIVKLLSITHPSAAFTPEYCHSIIHKFLQ